MGEIGWLSNVRFCLGDWGDRPGRKADIQADRPTHTFREIQPLFWHVCSNEVEPGGGYES